MDVTDEQIKSAWDSSQHILIIPNTNSNLDIIYASLALLSFAGSHNKKAQLLSPLLSKQKIWQYKLDSTVKKSLISEVSAQVAIDINSSDINPDDLQIIKTDFGIKILVNSAQEIVTENVKTEVTKGIKVYDFIIIVGSPNLELDESLKSSKILYLCNQEIPQEKLTNSMIVYKAASRSFSIKVFEMFHVFKGELLPDNASYLIAGLISFTNVFTKNIDARIFELCNDLIKIGGDYHQAYTLAVDFLTHNKAKLIGEGMSRIEYLSEGVYAYHLTKEQIQRTVLKQRDLFKFSEIYDCKLAFVFIDHNPLNKVYLKVSSKDLRLKTFLKDNQGKGNNYEGMILTKDNYATFMAKLLTFIKQD